MATFMDTIVSCRFRMEIEARGVDDMAELGKIGQLRLE